MNYAELRQRLDISNGTVTVSSSTLTSSINDFLVRYYNGQPLVLTAAVPGPDDGQNDTVVIRGEASFLNMPNLPVELRASLDPEEQVHLLLRYTVLGETPDINAWKFSRSFPSLPQVMDWNKTYDDPYSIPLDQLRISDSSFVVVTHPVQDPRFQVPLVPGINFVGRLHPTGIVGIIESVFNHSGDPLTLYGTVRIPTPTEAAIPLKPFQYPWDLEAPPAGITLQCDLGLGLTIGGMTLGDTVFRLYSPITADWTERNPTYKPILAYGGKLSIPSANLEVDVVAPTEPGSRELLLLGSFEGLSIANLAHLADMDGSGDFLTNMPDQIKGLGSAIGQLQLTHAAIDLALPTATGFELGMVSVTIGMPDLKWNVWDGHFEIDSIESRFTVLYPFNKLKRKVEVTVIGSMQIEGVPINVYAGNTDGFTVFAELGEKQTIPLKHLMETYVPGVPAPSDLTIDALNVTVAPFRSYGMALAMAEEPEPWVIDVGFEKLTVRDVILAFSYPRGGPLAGTFGGSISFGDAVTLGIRYDIPGDIVIRGLFPKVQLSHLLAKLVNQPVPLPSAFDLTFINSSVLIQKAGANYVFRVGTELEHFGLFALEVRKTGGSQWGVAAGIDLSAGLASQLPGLGALQAFEDLFRMEKLLFVVSSFDDVGFAFPDMAQFNNPVIAGGRLQLPGKGGVIAGLNFFAEWVIDTEDAKQKFLKQLLGLNPRLGITLQVGVDPSKDATLFVSYETKIEGLPLLAKFGGRMSSGSVGVFLEGAVQVEIQNQPHTFDVKLDFVENGAFISGTMKDNTPIDFEVFQIGNLALVLGCDWEGIPSLGVAGSIEAAGFESSIAVFFDSVEPQKSMVAGSLSNLSLKDVLDTLAGSVLPSEIDQVLDSVGIHGTRNFTISADLADDLDHLRFDRVASAFAANGVFIPATLQQLYFVVSRPGQRWFLTDQTNKMRHYQLQRGDDGIEVSLEAQLYVVPQRTQIGALPPFDPDFYINGAIKLLGFRASATIDIDPNRGIAVDAEMNRIVIGHEKLFSLSAMEGDGGPVISAATFWQPDHPVERFRTPHFYVNGMVKLLGLTREAFVTLTTGGFELELSGQMTPYLYLNIHGHIKGISDMNIGGEIKIGLDTIDLGPLGRIDINTGVTGKIDIGVSGSTIYAKVDGSFKFAGKSFDLPIELKVDADSLLDIAKIAYEYVKKKLLEFFQDAVEWAKHVYEKLIQGVEDVTRVLVEQFHKTVEEAKQIIDEAVKLAQRACSMTRAAIKM